MLEHRNQPLLPRRRFLRRAIAFAAVAMAIVLASLALGVLGYRVLEGMSWTDATLNAAMILGGMGPVTELHTDGGKLFASFYALFSGVVFLVAVGVLLAPIVHRVFHRFHLSGEDVTGKE